MMMVDILRSALQGLPAYANQASGLKCHQDLSGLHTGESLHHGAGDGMKLFRAAPLLYLD